MPASYANTAYTPDRLVVNIEDVLSRKITLAAGQTCLRGALLGAITQGVASKAAKTGGNTGAGTLTLDATTPILANAKVGVYTVRVVAVGTFLVVDPSGLALGEGIYAAGGTVTFANRIKFAFADDGTTHYVVGDGFDVTIAAGSGNYVLSVATAVDGSAVPDVILAEDCDASGGAAVGVAYFRGTFNGAAVIYGTGQTMAGVLEGLRLKGIDLVNVVAP